MPEERQSGLLKRISHMNPFHSVKFFVVCQSFLQLSQLMTSGYMKSSISTIEKRFGLTSQMSGLVASFNEVGNTMLIIFVSYFGSRVHRPRYIGYGAIFVSLGGFVISLPHFVTGPYEYDRSTSGSSKNRTDICLPNQERHEQCDALKERESRLVLPLLLFGQTLQGIGSVPIQPYGISYLDDFASRANSPLYIGLLYAVTTIGPAVAFIMGAFMLRFYVDFDKVSPAEIHLTQKDPRWVGAWWLGFMVSAGIVGIAAIPYFFFPRYMPKEPEPRRKSTGDSITRVDVDIEDSKIDYTADYTLRQFIRAFPIVLMRNIRNPIFVMVIVAMINLSAMIAGLATFLAKVLERQFSLTASVANMIIGAVNIPGGMLGIVLGGAIMKNCHLSLKQAALMCLITMGLCVICDIPLLFIGCPTQDVAGLDYSGSSGPSQLITDCNRMCNCSLSSFNPVCGQDNIEYVSPCFAGCTGINIDAEKNKVLNYTSCNCIIVDGAIGFARPGSCGSPCFHLLLPFVTIACISGFLGSLSHTPGFIFVLRSVKQEDKSFAIGLQFLMQRLLAWLPAPVLYGSAIDTACLLWQENCYKRSGCRYYDNTLLRQRFMGVQILVESSCFLCFCFVYLITRREEQKALQEDETRISSVISTSESHV